MEYALRDVHKPMGVAEYRLAQALPEHLKDSLPTVEQLEAELRAVGDDGHEGEAVRFVSRGESVYPPDVIEALMDTLRSIYWYRRQWRSFLENCNFL